MPASSASALPRMRSPQASSGDVPDQVFDAMHAECDNLRQARTDLRSVQAAVVQLAQKWRMKGLASVQLATLIPSKLNDALKMFDVVNAKPQLESMEHDIEGAMEQCRQFQRQYPMFPRMLAEATQASEELRELVRAIEVEFPKLTAAIEKTKAEAKADEDARNILAKSVLRNERKGKLGPGRADVALGMLEDYEARKAALQSKLQTLKGHVAQLQKMFKDLQGPDADRVLQLWMDLLPELAEGMTLSRGQLAEKVVDRHIEDHYDSPLANMKKLMGRRA